MRERHHHHRSTRLAYMGMLPKNDGMVIYARLEVAQGPAGWIKMGRGMELHVPDWTLREDAWTEAIADAADRAHRRLQAKIEEATREDPLF